MIQPQELRIGNYVEYRIQDELDERKEWLELSTIDATDLVILESGIDEDFRPIPLTEEILLKFGFLKDDNFYHLNNIWISNFYENYFSLDGFDETKIEYVHQLQNLYFALTGEELKFKN